jgi:hypothetical protein
MSEETIPQMREQIESLTADLAKARDSEKTALTQVRELSGQVIALGQGYTEAQGRLYAKVAEDELSAEGFDAFAQEQGLPRSGASSEPAGDESASTEEVNPPTTAPEGSAELSQMARSGSLPGDSAGGAQTEKMTRQAWQDLFQTDKNAAREAVRQGRVEIDPGNPFGDPRPVAPGVNPYAPSAQE